MPASFIHWSCCGSAGVGPQERMAKSVGGTRCCLKISCAWPSLSQHASNSKTKIKDNSVCFLLSIILAPTKIAEILALTGREGQKAYLLVGSCRLGTTHRGTVKV